ncbi:MAG: hypothetical protein QOF02_1302 [Blastocatellia bacterium]|jgi:hypothetical protein|nr:hypothetical protein [Blastocatellia bacterium]
MRTLLLLAAIAIISTNAFGQTRNYDPARLERMVFERSRSVTQLEIKAVKPAVSDDMLYRDWKALDASLPVVKTIFKKKGLDARHAAQAMLTGWYYLRTGRLKPTQRLSSQALIQTARALGILTITSTPGDAEVMVGNKRLTETTPTTAYCNPGPHRIQLSKPGYETLEETIDIKANKEIEFDRELKKQP